jgi:hypothetical protein
VHSRHPHIGGDDRCRHDGDHDNGPRLYVHWLMARRAGHNDDDLIINDALTTTKRFSSQDGGGTLNEDVHYDHQEINNFVNSLI